MAKDRIGSGNGLVPCNSMTGYSDAKCTRGQEFKISWTLGFQPKSFLSAAKMDRPHSKSQEHWKVQSCDPGKKPIGWRIGTHGFACEDFEEINRIISVLRYIKNTYLRYETHFSKKSVMQAKA